jgi:hypothetical protein
VQDLHNIKNMGYLNQLSSSPKNNMRAKSSERMGPIHNRHKAAESIGPYYGRGNKQNTAKTSTFFGSQMARAVTSGKFGMKHKGVFDW